MSELIDRQALLDECLNHYEVGNIEQNCTMDWICKTVRNFPTASPWRRVEDELPPMLYQAEGDDLCIDYSLLVLVYREASHDFWLARQMDDGYGATWGTVCFDELYGVTHWMPLPEPPKGDA